MDNHILLAILVILVLAGLILFFWLRRDRGEAPADQLPEAPAEAAPVEEREFVVQPAPPGPADDLTRMKGVGPKLAALLADLGVTNYSQIAEWSGEDIAAIDPRLGVFQGRPTRDRWVEQAGFLARGDTAGFEAQFGKLGE
jgi:predicted flap endonuclease-1-like 5' DNA nuclease